MGSSLLLGLWFLLTPAVAFATDDCPKVFPPLAPLQVSAGPAKNIILMIGDGMGPMQIEAAGHPFPPFPHQGMMTHCSLSGITDSAAAATALATGEKTLNGNLAMTAKDEPLETILELAEAQGRSTGLVTTAEITDATPAAFAAHVPSRKDKVEVARQYLEKTKPNFLAGGGRKYFEPLGLPGSRTSTPWRGYMVFDDLRSLRITPYTRSMRILGLFASENIDWVKDRPQISLVTMAEEALRFLQQNPQGFFLMIEGGRIDHAGHANDMERLIPEVKEFGDTVTTVLNWSRKHGPTLLLVTADHETGGLTQKNKSQKDRSYEWTTRLHTATPVVLWGYGPGSENIRDVQDNRVIFQLMNQALRKVAGQTVERQSHAR